MVSHQRLMIDVQTWTSSSNPPQKYDGLRGCSATIAGDARSLAASLLEELASCWLVLGSRGPLVVDDAVYVSSRVLGPV